MALIHFCITKLLHLFNLMPACAQKSDARQDFVLLKVVVNSLKLVP
jgi:hypothetical protein